MKEYHDLEWGVPVHDDRKHFEYLILDGFQAGLSWQTILNKRGHFRKAFKNFDPVKVSKFTQTDMERLMNDAGIVRNRLKIEAAIGNAKAFLKLREKFGSFDAWIWRFTEGKTLDGKRKTMKDIPVSSPESDAMSAALRKEGFRFVGSTICYAYMQAAGMVNDHIASCWRKNLNTPAR